MWKITTKVRHTVYKTYIHALVFWVGFLGFWFCVWFFFWGGGGLKKRKRFFQPCFNGPWFHPCSHALPSLDQKLVLTGKGMGGRIISAMFLGRRRRGNGWSGERHEKVNQKMCWNKVSGSGMQWEHSWGKIGMESRSGWWVRLFIAQEWKYHHCCKLSLFQSVMTASSVPGTFTE